MKLYVASPYRIGSKVDNVQLSLRAGEALIQKGHIPILPLLSHYWETHYYHEQDFWMNYDFELLLICDAVVRLPGRSLGADAEEAFALNHHIPIFYGLAAVPPNPDPPSWLDIPEAQAHK